MKIGIIGLGRAAIELHLPALTRISRAEVVLACDVKQENLQQLKATYPHIETTRDYQDLIGRDELDVIAILVPAFLHEEIGNLALMSGKSVFIEKPLALSLDSCQRLIDTQEANRNPSMVGFNLRFHRLVREARASVLSGMLGQIECISSVVTGNMRKKASLPDWRTRREQGGSPIFEIGIHQFDLWRWILGEPLEEITSRAIFFDGIERTATIEGITPSGILATGLFSDWTSDRNELTIFGSKGMIQVSIYRIDGLRRYSANSFAGGLSTRITEIKQAVHGITKFPNILALGGDFKATYFYEWQEFLSAVRGKELDLPQFADGKYATRVALAATHAIDTGKRIRVDGAPEKIPLAPKKQDIHGSKK